MLLLPPLNRSAVVMISLATLRQPFHLDDTNAADRRPLTADQRRPPTTDADADADTDADTDAADAADAAEDLLVEIFDLGRRICLIIQQSTN
jgi:hypothetical protein